MHLAGSWAPWIFAGFAIAFFVKTPVWPLHTWMPLTYSDLPAPMVSVVCAVQSKAGLYGFIAIALAFLPDYVHEYSAVLIVLGAISLVYGAVAALVQHDAKRVVAYSSLSHLGLIVIAIAVGNPLALAGAMVYMVAHGLFSAALFMLSATSKSAKKRVRCCGWADWAGPIRAWRARFASRASPHSDCPAWPVLPASS